MPDDRATELKRRALQAVDALAEPLLALSADLHAHPETRFEERHAAAAIAALVRDRGAGAAVEVGVGGLPTGLRSVSRGAGSGPTIALLAEYDALPGLGHGCGHNLIATASVGAFLALRGIPLPGTVMLVGTPGEEGGGGKIRLLDAGVFDGVDAALMIHPDEHTHPHVECGGRVALSITFRGRAAHAASAPEEGINALDAAVLLFNAVNALRPRLPEGARIHGIIAEGGRAPNVIPDRARVELYVRAFEPDVLERLATDVEACAAGAATATGCALEVAQPLPSYSSLSTSERLAAAFARNLDALGWTWHGGRHRTQASTDLGNLSQRMPTLHPYVGIGAGLRPHTAAFAAAAGGPAGERVALLGARALAMTAIDVLLAPALIAEELPERSEQGEAA